MLAGFLRDFTQHSWKFAVVIAVVALLVRLPGLGQFMTADEENWMLRSATFWHELAREGNPGGTFMTTHPGATTMWLSGAGIFLQETRLGFDIDTSNLRHFRLAAIAPIMLGVSVLIGVVAWLAILLLGRFPGGAAGVVLALDPYLVGMSQVVHLDVLLALFMLVAVLTFLFWQRERQQWLLIVSGLAAGLALATKFLPALWLFVFFVGALVLCRARFSHLVRVLGFVGGVALLTLYLSWPALWVKDDFFRSFERDVPSVVTQEHVALEVSDDPVAPASFYVRTLLGRSTPFVLVLLFGVLYGGVKVWRRDGAVPSALWLLVYGCGYLILITLAAKKADRYALPALTAFVVAASWFFGASVVAWRARRLRSGALAWRLPASAALIVAVLLLAQVFLWVPYAIAYSSPLFGHLRPASQQGWGEGLDAAARWLNAHPLRDRLTVASWYPSVTATYFDGKTMSLSSRDDERVGFVILYRNMFGRAADDVATDVLDEYRGQQPAHVVSIAGEPYAWIFDTIGLPYFNEHTGEIVGGMEVGQTVRPAFNGWSGVEIALATFSGRANTEDVVLHVREQPGALEALRTVVVSASVIEDRQWHHFDFEPIADSSGKQLYISLTSPTSATGNAIAAWFASEDILPGQLFLRRRVLHDGEQQQSFIRDGDLAYRLIY